MCRVPRHTRRERELQFLYLSFLKQFLNKDSVPCTLITFISQSTSNKAYSACWSRLHPVFPSNLITNVSGFLDNQADPITLITLNSQSTSNKSNSACWNRLLPLFPSNLLTKVSSFLNNQADFIYMQSLPCPDESLKVSA